MTSRRHYSTPAQATTLSSSASSSGNISVTSMPGTWPSSYPFRILVDWGLSTMEAIDVTGVSGSGPYTLTCTRGVDGTTAQSHSSGAMVAHGFSGQDFGPGVSGASATADYIIFLDGTTVICVKTADNSYNSGSDAGALLQDAITDLAGTGGTIAFQSGSYAWSSVPAIPAALPTWLKITGEPGTTITLSSDGPRFLDFDHTATGITYQYLWLDGFTVDASAIQSQASTVTHIVIGTYADNSTATAEQVNFDHITIRNIRALNLYNDPSQSSEHLAIWIDSVQTASGQDQNTITNILIENIEVTGGCYAVYVGGDGSSDDYDINVSIDQVRIRDIRHDVGNDPSAIDAASFAHVHVGGGAEVGTVWIERVWGRGSRDVGIELDQCLDAHVRDCYFLNTHGYVLAITNYLAPSDINQQHYWCEDITHVRTAGTWASNGSSLVGLVQEDDGGGTAQAFGHFTGRNLMMYVDGSGLDDIWTDTVQGEFITIQNQPLTVDIQGGQYYATGYQQTNTGNQAQPSVIAAYPPDAAGASRMKLTLKDLDLYLSVTNSSGAVPAFCTLMELNGSMDIDIGNCSFQISNSNDNTTASFSDNTNRGINLGWDDDSSVNGTIRGCKFNGFSDSYAFGIQLSGGNYLTIPGKILIEDCDFSGMSSGQVEVEFQTTQGTPNYPGVFLRNNTWITMPKAPYTLTGTHSSGTAYQYLEGWPATLSLSATTDITVVALGKASGTTYNVWQTTATTIKAVGVHINNGEWFKITYSGTLTITVIPDD